MLADILVIVTKDLKLDLRRAENFVSMLFFSLVILLVFAFALPPEYGKEVEIVSGLFWISFLLGGILSLSQSFQLEKENACIEGILVSPVSRGSIYLGKMLSNIIFILVVQCFVIPILGILFNPVVFTYFVEFFLLGVVAAVGFSSLGTLLAGLTSDIRFKEILLPLLLFPLLVPLLLASVSITKVILTGGGIAGAGDWLRLLVGFDLIFLIISYLTFDFVMEF